MDEWKDAWARLFINRLTLIWDYSLTKVPVCLIQKRFQNKIPSGRLKATKDKM